MQVDTDTLLGVAEQLRRAAGTVSREPRAPSTIGADAPRVDGAHAAVGTLRSHALARVAEVLHAHAAAGEQAATLFCALDTQLASLATGAPAHAGG